MKSSSIPLVTFLLTLLTFTNALQSKGFYLKLKSSNSTLDGQSLWACHTGAAIEQPCVLFGSEDQGPKEVKTFYYNYTSANPSQGKLIWNLIATGPHNQKITESEPMSFDFNVGRNIVGTVFLPGGKAQPIGFDANNMMYISDYKTEITENPNSTGYVKLYRWQICTITEGDEFYPSLTWLLGTGEPSLPGCQAVGVQRVYV